MIYHEILFFIIEKKEIYNDIILFLSSKKENIQIHIAHNFEEFFYFLDKSWNAILFDAEINKEDLKYAIKKIHEKNADIPILILTQKYNDDDTSFFFELGAKDIICYKDKNKLFHVLNREYENQKLLNERKELLYSSQMNEELYRSLIELQSGFIRKITPTGNYIYVNQAYCDYMKKSRKEIYSENLFLSLPASSRNIYISHIRSLTPQKSSSTVEYSIQSSEGIKYQVWTDHGIFDSLGRLQAIIGVGQDITESRTLERERREINKKLRKSEKDFRDMALNVPGVIFQFRIFQNKASFSYVSPRAWDILKIHPEDLRKRISALKIYKEDRKNFFKTLRKNLSNQSSINLECRIQTKDDELIWIQFIANPIRSHEIIYNGVIIDISSRKEVEIDLERQKQLFSNLFHFSPVGIAILNKEGVFINANKSFLEITGYTQEDLQKIKINNLFLNQNINFLFKNEDINKQEEYEIKTKQNNVKIVLFQSNILNYGNKQDSDLYIITILDITQQKLLEEKLTQKNKMESIGNLASSIAHDFNNFLQPIILSSNMIAEELKNETNIKIEKIKKYNKNIIDSSEKSKNLVAQILDFARKTNNNYTKIEVTKTIKNSFLSILNSYPNENIKTRLLIHEKNLYTLGDPFAMNQIILNLFTNALDAMKDRKEKIIELEIKSIENYGILKNIITDFSKLIYIRFTDNGIGIPKEKINYIFEPFYTDKAHGKGTGLGLSIVYGIINRMKGAIQVESEVGVGTSFIIYIPLIEK